MSKEPHPFSHTQVPLPEDCIFKISPSAISKFFEMPVVWYKEHVLQEKQFKGNTASVLGSIIHGLAEMYVKGEATSADIVEDYLKQFRFHPDVNLQEIRELYPDMSKALINDYIRTNKPLEVERSLLSHLGDGVYLAGTCDNLTGTKEAATIVDYKNVSTKPNIASIPWNYYIQLMAYAKMYKDQGYNVDKIRLVYTVRPTKTLPIRVFKVNKIIGEEDFKALDDALTIIKDSILFCRANPEYTYLVFKSMQFKDIK